MAWMSRRLAWLLGCALTVVVLSVGAPSGGVHAADGRSLSAVDVSLPADANVHATGDFNSDLHTDLLLVSNDAMTLSVWLWDHGRYAFQAPTPGLTIRSAWPILNVAGGDFNYDGHLDVLVSGFNTSDPGCTVACIWTHIYFGAVDTFVDTSGTPSVRVVPNADDQLLVFDANNDLRLDLFGSSHGTRMAWINTPADDHSTCTFTTVVQPAPTSGVGAGAALRPLTVPQSHAFVDVDGDCAADLFVTSTDAVTNTPYFEIWLNRKSDGGFASTFVLDKQFAARPGHGTVTWGDFDADGTMDLAFPVCWPLPGCAAEQSIHVVYNTQKDMCSSAYSSSSSCRHQDDLCSADPNYAFGDPTDTGSAAHVVVDTSTGAFVTGGVALTYVTNMLAGADRATSAPTAAAVAAHAQELFNADASPLAAHLLAADTPVPRPAAVRSSSSSSSSSLGSTPLARARALPVTLRVGDIDLDGYPDLLVALQTVDSGASRLYLWDNVECSTNTNGGSAPCTADATNAGRRTFAIASDVSGLSSVQGAYAGAFFDVNDNGALGVVALHTALDAPNTAGMTTRNLSTALTTVLVNEFHTDAYFLTTLGSNGVCPAWCSSGDKFPSPKPYGVNYAGASVKFTVTSIDGHKSPRQGAQLSQSSYLSLQTPYNVFGLGRTNNYIEQFFVGYPLPQSTNAMMWVTIIPNSQLVLFPYPSSDPSSWTLELFISPSSRLLWVGVSLACTCVLLMGIIGFFHWRELKQDEADKKTTEHLFAF